jgi:ATP-dependent DNA helicase RecQ
METLERKQVQELFIKDEVNIIVATIAFGMGIDKPDVRLVVHYTYPKTLEGYYQEIGRAGRDGLESECIMFYTYADTRKHEFFINQIQDDILAKRAQEKLAEVLNYAELTTCRKKYLLRYFGEEMAEDCQSCDACLIEKEYIDATEIAKKILSAVYRTGESYGKNYIIEVLLGKKIQRVVRNGHDELSVFGIVDDFSADDLGQLLTQLISLGYLIKMPGKYPTLKLTQKAANFLNSNETLELQKPQVSLETKAKKLDELDYNQDLFNLLRALRKKQADEENVPPFVIFGDKALQEMAYYLPGDKDAFSDISGVGAKKLEKYGDDFISLIKKFSEEKNLESKIKNKEKRPERVVKVRRAQPKFYLKTKELLIKKIPLERIAKNQDLTLGTVINHLEKMIDAGEKLDLEYLKLPRDRYEKISQAFGECGDEKLKPVFEYLDGEHDYDAIRLVRVLMKSGLG